MPWPPSALASRAPTALRDLLPLVVLFAMPLPRPQAEDLGVEVPARATPRREPPRAVPDERGVVPRALPPL